MIDLDHSDVRKITFRRNKTVQVLVAGGQTRVLQPDQIPEFIDWYASEADGVFWDLLIRLGLR